MNTTKNMPSPCYVLDIKALTRNLELIKNVSDQAGVDIILAFKGFALWRSFPLIKKYITGASASSLHEVMLCNEYMKSKAHTYAVAYKKEEISQLLAASSHITFNSVGQLNLYHDLAKASDVSVGLRINPEYSDVTTALYNPAAPDSRLGVTADQLRTENLPNIDGLHFHVLCESDAYALETTLHAVEDKFGWLLPKIKWLNVGGGHLMTKKGYDTDHLIKTLKAFKKKHNIALIMEPGSAFAWEAGSLYTTVVDIVSNGGVQTAIIDASITCHMPDCLEMPYRPNINEGQKDASQSKFVYRIGGSSCLAGDYLEAYSFDAPLQIGDTIEFLDMMHYTMVKTTTFNGIQHPSIAIRDSDGKTQVIKEFGYEDYKNRLS